MFARNAVSAPLRRAMPVFNPSVLIRQLCQTDQKRVVSLSRTRTHAVHLCQFSERSTLIRMDLTTRF
jgi:hypothetical protein